jgi:hypothetical protein
MEGFKTLPKMLCLKAGGVVKNIMKRGGKAEAVSKADVQQDKKIVKKAFGMHDDQLHEGERTDLSKLKHGGRAKKATGTVRKYKTGGSVKSEAGKPSGDAVKLEKVSPTGDKKASAPSKGAKKPAFKGSDVSKTNKLPAGTSKAKKVSEGPKEAEAASGAKGGPNKYKTGGGVKKMAAGRQTAPLATGPGSIAKAHELALLEQMRKLPPAMQLQLLNQQQQIGGNNALNNIANQANPQVAPQQPTNMGTLGQ